MNNYNLLAEELENLIKTLEIDHEVRNTMNNPEKVGNQDTIQREFYTQKRRYFDLSFLFYPYLQDLWVLSLLC